MVFLKSRRESMSLLLPRNVEEPWVPPIPPHGSNGNIASMPTHQAWTCQHINYACWLCSIKTYHKTNSKKRKWKRRTAYGSAGILVEQLFQLNPQAVGSRLLLLLLLRSFRLWFIMTQLFQLNPQAVSSRLLLLLLLRSFRLWFTMTVVLASNVLYPSEHLIHNFPLPLNHLPIKLWTSGDLAHRKVPLKLKWGFQ